MRMKTLFASSLYALFLIGTSGVPASGSPDPGASGAVDDPVFIDSTDILYLESFPVQVHLLVRGSLPTPCHEAVWEVQHSGDLIDVRLWSTTDAGEVCMTVLEPFDITIPLGAFESASLPVFLNGEEVGRVEVGAEPGPAGASLGGAGRSFGMCMGYCSADLVIDGDSLALTGRQHMVDDPLFVNHGALTTSAQERIAAALSSLEGVVLEPVYGCPDCADGGAAYLTISVNGVASRHDMELGSPPLELTDLHGLAMAMIDALERCASNDLVVVAVGCRAWEG